MVALRNPNNYESNPFLGARPSAGKINSVCALGLLLNTFLAGWVFRGEERSYFWAGVSVLEIANTTHNVVQMGIHTTF